MAWHTLPADAPLQDVDKFEAQALEKFKVDLPEVPPRYRTSYFDHIWGGGYSAGYYAYFWSEVLDDDAFEWFKEHGGLTRENGQVRSEEHTSELQSLMRISYAVFCLKKKTKDTKTKVRRIKTQKSE